MQEKLYQPVPQLRRKVGAASWPPGMSSPVGLRNGTASACESKGFTLALGSSPVQRGIVTLLRTPLSVNYTKLSTMASKKDMRREDLSVASA